MKKELYIELHVHKDSITVAVAQSGRDGQVRLYGTISNGLHAIEKLLTRLPKAHGENPRIELCYEAGRCGFVIARRLRQLEVPCIVVAPSMTPRRSGDRIKTDCRDAVKLVV
jgi:transposase